MKLGNISLLGSTGSIGKQTLDVVRKNRDQFHVAALAAGSQADLLIAQAREFSPEYVAIGDETQHRAVRSALPAAVRVEAGAEALCEAATLSSAHTVVGAVVGFACLRPVLAAVQAGKHIALANKECLVAAGALICQAAAKSGSVLAPVDSEHNSIFQCLQGRKEGDELRRVILTASGGPFYKATIEELQKVTPELAVKHPRWNMGAKISVDSASLMNKGLEVIEASWLFGLPPERIGVLIHPQSIVHGFVEYEDGALIACLYDTDMRQPISHALGHLRSTDPCNDPGPRLSKNCVSALDLAKKGALEFYEPDLKRFPALGLAYEALRSGGTMPTVLNAANEIAVDAFLAGRIPFLNIPKLVEQVMSAHAPMRTAQIQDVFAVDSWAREQASNMMRKTHAVKTKKTPSLTLT